MRPPRMPATTTSRMTLHVSRGTLTNTCHLLVLPRGGQRHPTNHPIFFLQRTMLDCLAHQHHSWNTPRFGGKPPLGHVFKKKKLCKKHNRSRPSQKFLISSDPKLNRSNCCPNIFVKCAGCHLKLLYFMSVKITATFGEFETTLVAIQGL